MYTHYTGLASHWPCVTDLVSLSIYLRVEWSGEGDEHPHRPWVMGHFTVLRATACYSACMPRQFRLSHACFVSKRLNASSKFIGHLGMTALSRVTLASAGLSCFIQLDGFVRLCRCEPGWSPPRCHTRSLDDLDDFPLMSGERRKLLTSVYGRSLCVTSDK